MAHFGPVECFVKRVHGVPCIVGRTCEYVVRVIEMLACPSISWTTLG